jgi:hypothetical protein
MPDGSPSPPPPPGVPEERLAADGWTLQEHRAEALVELPAAEVLGHTLVYEDGRLRAAVREATGGRIDRMWRYFFATRLTFRPPLPPGVGPAMVVPTVARTAESAFADELEERGFRDVSRGRRERVRVDTGERARLRRYTATLDDGDAGIQLDVAGWLGVWTHDGFRVAGGAYPATPLGALLHSDEVGPDPNECRDELLDLIRAVS